MLLVQAKVKKITGEYTLEQKEELLKGTKIDEMAENATIQNFLEKEIIDVEEENKKYYVLDKQNLEELDLQKVKLKEDSYYIVEYTSNEVYYTKGVEYADGNTYYDIKEIENLEASEVE